MHVQPLFTVNNDATLAYIEAWFMNKVSASGVVKVPIRTLLGSKQRSMQSILGFLSMNYDSQKQVRHCAPNNGVEDRCYGSPTSNIDTGIATKSLSQGCADIDIKDMEKITLRDMKRKLRKGIENPLDKVGSAESVSGNHSCSSSDSGMLLSADSQAPSVALELLLEDSTSNSSESMSLKRDLAGIPFSSGMQGNFADSLCGHKRLSMASESSEETEAAEDDEWTLQKWQKLYYKESAGRKRLQKACKLQAKVSEINAEVCSSSSSLAVLDANAGVSEVASLQKASCFSEKIIKENCETDNSDCKPYGGPAALKDSLPSNRVLALEQSCQLLPSMASLELEEESESVSSKAPMLARLQDSTKNGWVLKSCSKTETNSSSKSALQQVMLGGKSSSNIPFRKAGELLGSNPESAGIKVSGQRKQSEEITWSISPGNVSSSEEQRTASSVHNSNEISKPVSVPSQDLPHVNVNQAHTTMNDMPTNVPIEQLESKQPLEYFQGRDCPEQSDSIVSQLNSKEPLCYTASLKSIETLEIEEEQEPHQKPAKIPCRRKAISPMSQEFLLKASKLGEFGVIAEKRGLVDEPKWTAEADSRNAQNLESSQGSLHHVKEQWQASNVLQSNALPVASPENCIGGTSMTSRHTPVHAENRTVSFSKLSPKIQNAREDMPIILSSGLSLRPTKGILKSKCQGPCGCEECASVRSRAERASEFSQRQMQDIEGLAVKLMKDLSILRNIVEDRLLQGSAKQSSPRPAFSVDQLKKVTANALETEEKAKKWLVRMARDCNRYCKIMRMQGRKLTFADDSGGKLCQVKVFCSEPVSDSSMGLHERLSEVNGNTSHIPREQAAVEAACSFEDTTTKK